MNWYKRTWAEVESGSFNPKVIKEGVLLGRNAISKAPKVYGVPTGVEGLDDLFFITKIENGKPIKKPLGGFRPTRFSTSLE